MSLRKPQNPTVGHPLGVTTRPMGGRVIHTGEQYGANRTDERLTLSCPWCEQYTDASRWSFPGSGRRCQHCKAVMFPNAAYHFADPVLRPDSAR